MMLEPSIKTLTEKVPSRFMLVNSVAQRARMVAEDADERQVPLSEKPISIAVRELAEGKLRVHPGEEFYAG